VTTAKSTPVNMEAALIYIQTAETCKIFPFAQLSQTKGAATPKPYPMKMNSILDREY